MLRHKKRNGPTDGTAVFGIFDGLVSVIGVIVGLLAGPKKSIIAAAVGLAVASGASMGFGEWLGDAKRSWKKALIMGAATLVGTMLPIVPFLLFGKRVASVIASLFALAATGYIASQRARDEPTVKAYVETFLILLVSVALTVLVTFLTGSAG